MRRFTFLAIAALCVLTASSGLVAQSPTLTPFRGLVDRVSADPWGSIPYDPAELWHGAISGDGRYVVFNSRTSYLESAEDFDWNGYDDIFLRDRMTGTTTRISKPHDGSGAANGISQMATISTNGRHVAFASGAMNLVAGDTNWVWDVFVRDLDQQRTVRVSVATDGSQGDRDAYYPSLSADGRFVAFVSWSTTFAPGVSSSAPRQMYVHDRDADSDGIFDEPGEVTTELISVGLTGGIADDGVDSPRVSGDGRYVLFESAATNLSDVGNANGMTHLYRRDRLTGQTEFIDRAVTGGPSQWGVGYGTSDMTDDGRFITFSSSSPDIVWTGGGNGQSQVFRYDTFAAPTGTTIVSSLPDGTLGDGSSYGTSVSGDGRYVVFSTAASNLAWPAPGINGSGPGLLAVRDMLNGSIERVDVLDTGEAFYDSDYYYNAAVSADGTAIVVPTRSSNATEGPQGLSHVVVMTAFSAEPAWSASYSAAGGNGSIEVNTTAVTGWKAWSPWEWIVVTEGDGFGAGPRTVQYVVSANLNVNARDGWIRIGSKYIQIHQDGNSEGDGTPPIIIPTITGTQVNGWYTSDVSITWSVTDPESEIIEQFGCVSTTFTTDLVQWVSCQATSHGGMAHVPILIRRDTTPPIVTVGTPTPTIYSAGSLVTPSYNCNEASGSGVAACAVTQGSSPLNTTPGRHVFTVTSTDGAGNSASRSVEYFVGSGVCVTPSVSPANYLKVWLPLNGGSDPWRDRASGGFFGPMTASGGFQTAVVDQGWSNSTAGNYLIGGYPASNYTIDTVRGERLTIAAWVKPQFASTGTILSNPMQYRVARFPDGTLRWAFNQDQVGFTWRNTGVVVPNNVWSHVAVTYSNGDVRTYLNGRLVSQAWVFNYLQITGDPNAGLTVGGRAGVSESLLGVIDDVMLFKEALTAGDIESLALAGSGSLCVPHTSTITLTAPATMAYAATFPVTALLTDESGTPLADREVEIASRVGPTGYLYQFNVRTAANGTATVQLPVSASATLGSYANAITAYFPGDITHGSSQIVQGATLVAGTPAVTWSPAPIVYGNGLSAAQLNATASVSGTFTYSPAAGTILTAGNQTLGVTFTPDDTSHWGTTTRTATLVVNKATPTVTAVGGTFIYDNQPHAGSGTATGVFGESLTPVTLTYNGGSSTPPTNGGSHTVRASYAESQNYTAAQSADATLTITRATPTVEISTEPVFYTSHPRTATVFVRGIDGVQLNPNTVLYNGSTTAPTNAGTYALEVQYAGSANYAPLTATGSFVIRKTTPILGPLANIGVTYDGQPHGGYNVSIPAVEGGWLTPVIYSYNGSATEPVNAGVYTAVVRYDGSANYEAVSTTYTLTIFKARPYLQWGIPSSLTYGQPLGSGQLNAFADMPGTFTYSPPAGTILNAGTHPLTVTFTPPDTANYEIVSATRQVSVDKAYPQVAWAHPADIVYGTPLSAAQLTATANVPGTFAYDPSAGTVLNAGEQILRAPFTPDDLANYRRGVTATTWVIVTKAMPAVSWNAPPDIVYGTALDAAQLNATANVPGTFSYSPAAGTVLGAGARTLSVTFTPTDAANYSSTTSSVTLNVAKAESTISWSNPADIVYGTALGGSQLNATANVPGTFSYSPAAGTVPAAGTRTLSVTFTPSDANYDGSTASVTLNVAKAGTTLIWSPVAGLTYGTPLGVAQLNAFAVGVDGTFSYSPPAGTILAAGIHTLSVTFTPNDPANYNGASATVLTEVSRAASTISWSSPAAIVYGTALGGSQLNATANVPGTFSYSPAIGTVLNAGWHTLSVTFEPDDANYIGATSSVELSVTRAASTIAWSNPADIVYGNVLSAAQLNATANVAGTFSYSPAAGAVLNAGPQTLSVTFTPDDAANYNGSSASVSLTVNRAGSAVSWSNPAGVVYGTALGAAQLNATANVAGTFSYSPAAGTVLGAGSHTLSVTFTPDDAANYNGSSANVTLNISKASSTVSWSNPAGIVYGTALGASQLNATASVAGTFSYAPASGTVLNAGGHTLSVAFTPDDSANYASATANVSIAVAKAVPVLAWANPAGITYGTALSGTQLNATANVSGSFGYSPGAGTVLGAGTHNLSVTFSPADDANYTSASAAATIAIAPSALTVQAANASKVYGEALPAFTASGIGFVNGDSMASLGGALAFATSATATSGPGTYVITPSGVSSPNYSIAFAAGTLTVAKAATSLALTTTPNPSQNNQVVQLRAVVAAVAPGAGTATGTVSFYENGTLLGSATLVNGVATLNKAFKKGTHPLTATYGGNVNFTGSSGAVTHQTP